MGCVGGMGVVAGAGQGRWAGGGVAGGWVAGVPDGAVEAVSSSPNELVAGVLWWAALVE